MCKKQNEVFLNLLFCKETRLNSCGIPSTANLQIKSVRYSRVAIVLVNGCIVVCSPNGYVNENLLHFSINVHSKKLIIRYG